MALTFIADAFDDPSCASLPDPEVMFATKASPQIVRMCETCPLYRPCGDYASRVPVYGIWAGKTLKQRQKRNPQLVGKLLPSMAELTRRVEVSA